MPLSRRRAVLLAVVVAASVGCTVRDPGDTTPATSTDAPEQTDAADPRRAALAAEVEQLTSTVRAARDLLATARDAAGTSEGRDAAADAVATLTAAEELVPTGATAAAGPLFPGPETSREQTIDYGDVLTTALTAARAAGGDGQAVVRLLADPVAGDLGTWQRDAEGRLEEIAAAADADTVEAAEEAVLALDGEGTRALAYALLAVGTSDAAAQAAYAERGVAHLDVVLSALTDTGGTP